MFNYKCIVYFFLIESIMCVLNASNSFLSTRLISKEVPLDGTSFPDYSETMKISRTDFSESPGVQKNDKRDQKRDFSNELDSYRNHTGVNYGNHTGVNYENQIGVNYGNYTGVNYGNQMGVNYGNHTGVDNENEMGVNYGNHTGEYYRNHKGVNYRNYSEVNYRKSKSMRKYEDYKQPSTSGGVWESIFGFLDSALEMILFPFYKGKSITRDVRVGGQRRRDYREARRQ